jgi:predicted nucleic acid-binding protein
MQELIVITLVRFLHAYILLHAYNDVIVPSTGFKEITFIGALLLSVSFRYIGSCQNSQQKP